jgi:hypothetical protein
MKRRKNQYGVPPDMVEGSNGTGAEILLTLLVTWFETKMDYGAHFTQREIDCFHQLEANGTLGKIAMKCLRIYKGRNKLNIRTGCDAEMRDHLLRKYRIDFEDRLLHAKGGTQLVQPDGIVYTCWSGACLNITDLNERAQASLRAKKR